MVSSNCHKEIHYLHLNKENIEKWLLEFNIPNKSFLDKKHKTTICKKKNVVKNLSILKEKYIRFLEKSC